MFDSQIFMRLKKTFQMLYINTKSTSEQIRFERLGLKCVQDPIGENISKII
jgi:hypothetical protein